MASRRLATAMTFSPASPTPKASRRNRLRLYCSMTSCRSKPRWHRWCLQIAHRISGMRSAISVTTWAWARSRSCWSMAGIRCRFKSLAGITSTALPLPASRIAGTRKRRCSSEPLPNAPSPLRIAANGILRAGRQDDGGAAGAVSGVGGRLRIGDQRLAERVAPRSIS